MAEHWFDTTDLRSMVLFPLLSKGVIDQAESDYLMRITQPRDGAEVLIGLIAGQLDKRPLEIQQALEGTEYQTTVGQIVKQEESYSAFVSGVSGGLGGTLAGLTGPGIFFDISQTAGKAVGDFFATSGWFQDDQSPYIMSEGATEESAALVVELKALVDKAVSSGALTENEGAAYKGRADAFSPGDIMEMVQELRGVELSDEDWKPLAGAITSAIGDAGLEKPVIESASLTEGDFNQEFNAEQYSNFMAGGRVNQETGEVDDIDLSSINSFGGLLQAVGSMATEGNALQFTRSPRSTLDYIMVDGVRVNIGQVGAGPGSILDRATGAVMSNDIYDAIQANDAIKQRYAELGKQMYSDALTDLITSKKFASSKQLAAGKIGIPLEDLGIASVAATEEWQIGAYDWVKGSGAAQWQGMSAYSRRAKTKYMVDKGLISDSEAESFFDPFSLAGGQMWEQVNGLSRDLQISQYSAMNSMASEAERIRMLADDSGGGRGARGPTYSVPASLRTIPDYKALAVETKNAFQQRMGREPEDWEMAMLSETLGQGYEERNAQLREVNKAAWDEAQSGGTLDVENFEITDPASTLQYDMEETYAGEIERRGDVVDYGANRQQLMDSISIGRRMI